MHKVSFISLFIFGCGVAGGTFGEPEDGGSDQNVELSDDGSFVAEDSGSEKDASVSKDAVSDVNVADSFVKDSGCSPPECNPNVDSGTDSGKDSGSDSGLSDCDKKHDLCLDTCNDNDTKCLKGCKFGCSSKECEEHCGDVKNVCRKECDEVFLKCKDCQSDLDKCDDSCNKNCPATTACYTSCRNACQVEFSNCENTSKSGCGK